MANIFLNIPVVVGPGPAVDISAMGAEKTIVVSGSLSEAVTLEFSEDGGASWSPLTTFTGTGKRVISFAANRIRANLSGILGVTINIGANDDGGSYVVIPAPPKNGVGAVVDITNLGNFTTVAVQGTFGGGVVGVEISEDGVNFAEFATFANAGSITKNMVGDFVRARSRGAIDAIGAPYAPICSMGAINDAGGSSVAGTVTSSSFLYQPGGGGTGPAVFDDWNDLYAALEAARLAGGPHPGGVFAIAFDDLYVFPSPVVVPAGTYDMHSVIWENRVKAHATGFVPTPINVELAPGVLLEDLSEISGFLHVTSTGPVSPIFMEDGDIFVLQLGSSIASTDAPFLNATNVLAGGGFEVVCNTGGMLGDGTNPVLFVPNAGSTVLIGLGSAGVVQPNAIDFAVGTLLLAPYLTVSSKIEDSQPLFLGSYVGLLISTWRYNNNGVHGGALPVTVSCHVGDIVRCNPTEAQVNVDLPPITLFNDGQTVVVKSVTPNNGTININPSGTDTIDGVNATLTLTTGLQSVTLAINSSTNNWDVISLL